MAVFQFSGGAGCWGYTAPDGREYAIIGAGNGVGVVNVTDMRLVGTIRAAGCHWREVKTYQHYCYAVSDCWRSEGMLIIDLQWLPDSLHLVGAYSPPGRQESHNISIDTATGYCYLQYGGGFRIISLEDPEHPLEVSYVETGGLHDLTVFNDTAWTAEGFSSFSIWDLANKHAPVQLAHVELGGGYVHNIWPSSDRKIVVTTEETANRTVKIWDTSDLTSISVTSEYLGPSDIAHNAFLDGDYLYIAHYDDGVVLIDLSDRNCPVELFRFDTNPDFSGWSGCWGVYPYTAGGKYVYASNMDGRFFIFRTTRMLTQFDASPTSGPAPLGVNFNNKSLPVADYVWDFGDGTSSTETNPTHIYGPGLYTVQLTNMVAAGQTESRVRQNFITALAETLKVESLNSAPDRQVVVAITYRNFVPIEELIMPVSLSDSLGIVKIDSVSTTGCRTDYFNLKAVLPAYGSNDKVTVRLRANGRGALPPGDGPIARVHITASSVAEPGSEIVITTPPSVGGGYQLSAETLSQRFVPEPARGFIRICECNCHADADCNGELTRRDVADFLGDLYSRQTRVNELHCPVAPADADCNGITDLTDIVRLVNVVVRGEVRAFQLCTPCR